MQTKADIELQYVKQKKVAFYQCTVLCGKTHECYMVNQWRVLVAFTATQIWQHFF